MKPLEHSVCELCLLVIQKYIREITDQLVKNSYEKLAFFLIFTQCRAIKVLYFEIKHRKSFRISFTPLGGEVFFPEMTGMLMNAMEPQTQQVGADDTCGSRVYVSVCVLKTFCITSCDMKSGVRRTVVLHSGLAHSDEFQNAICPVLFCSTPSAGCVKPRNILRHLQVCTPTQCTRTVNSALLVSFEAPP